MKKVSTEEYKARFKDGSYLMTHGSNHDEIEREIDEANARAVALGYKPYVFQITCIETYVWYEDDGTFIKREVYESVIETYPEA